ncbi:MAG: hypothetical protein ABSB50_18365 [Terracidiphilus sp.]
MLKGEQQTRPIPWRSLSVAAIAIIAVTLAVRSERVDVLGAGELAAILVAVSFALLLRAAVKTGSFFSGYTLALGTFLLTYPLSAFVHLTGSNYISLGFYEIAALDPHTQRHHVYFSLALVLAAQLALWWGLAPGRPKAPSDQPHIVRVRSRLLVLAGLLFTLIGIAGTYLLFSASGEFLRDLMTVDSARELAAGTARFAFMSSWFSWGIIFLLTAFLASRISTDHPRFALTALAGGSACMFLNLFWTGSRAENLLAVLPLLFVVKKVAPRHFPSFLSLIAVGVTGIIAFETIARTTALLNSGLNFLAENGTTPGQFIANQLASVFDWQIGRFSSISLAFDMVHRYGYASGSTLLQGFTTTINAPATLLHISWKVPEPQAMAAVVGEYIYDDPTKTGVVPGTVAELYFNFGILGVVGGFFVIGRIARYCTTLTHTAENLGSMILAFYVLALLCVSTIPMTATTILYSLTTSGFPILFLFACEQILTHAAKPRQESLSHVAVVS